MGYFSSAISIITILSSAAGVTGTGLLEKPEPGEVGTHQHTVAASR
jgi:hypothetical protein